MSEKVPLVCPRLVDYLTIVGNNTVPHKQHGVQQPQMLARYPPTDHKVGERLLYGVYGDIIRILLMQFRR